MKAARKQRHYSFSILHFPFSIGNCVKSGLRVFRNGRADCHYLCLPEYIQFAVLTETIPFLL